ncbi:MAG TPA: hypothetical protein VFN23_16630 [Ktedonobacteraceae bacterium]|nr:hypothetical protein [Ktedonobacteraceae bacterium]
MFKTYVAFAVPPSFVATSRPATSSGTDNARRCRSTGLITEATGKI